MRFVIIIVLLLAAHFSLTVFVPGAAGKAAFYWPWAADTQPVLAGIGGVPQQGGGFITPSLAGIAGLCLLGAVAALLGIVVPAEWWTALVIVGAVASLILFVLYFSPLAIAPIILDIVLLYGVFIQHWTVASINGL